jgi:hypothetical protein
MFAALHQDVSSVCYPSDDGSVSKSNKINYQQANSKAATKLSIFGSPGQLQVYFFCRQPYKQACCQ